MRSAPRTAGTVPGEDEAHVQIGDLQERVRVVGVVLVVGGGSVVVAEDGL